MSEENSITDFTCEVDGRKLTGTCQEKEEAKNTYDDAIAEVGHPTTRSFYLPLARTLTSYG